jgi:3-oxoacyl-[acyl-carrier protein] reductase
MKRALVTGGSGGIGSEICRKLALLGYHVYVHANNSLQRAEEIVAEIKDAGGSAQTIAFDVANAEQTLKALQTVLSEGAIQVLVNNAGIYDDAVMVGMNAQQWARVIDISLNGFFNVTQPLLLPMIATRWGRVINISSVAAISGNRGQTNYAAAKAGLHGATKSLALEVSSRGITVNAIAPGIIESAMTENLFDKDTIKRLVPAGRAGKPEEVADLVAFIASDKAAYISGQIISINGAMS